MVNYAKNKNSILVKSFIISGLLLCVLLIQSCGVNSNVMLKGPKGEHANLDSLPLYPITEYRIGTEDKIVFSISTNDGTKLIEALSNVSDRSASNGFSPEFVVRPDSTVQLPVIGETKIAGLTIVECERLLEKKFSVTYQDPFVQVRITNQRVIVFPGGGGDAKVIPLFNSNTTLMEAIAQAGGIPDRGNSKIVKLMRKENGVRKVYTIDLSTESGLKYTDVILQANDYVYVEPNPQVAKEVVKEVAPIISLISSLLIIVTFILRT
jgi:polysaccharide export outer membrane protein